MSKKINKYLFVITIILVLFVSIILFFYMNEKNISVQAHLGKIQKNLNLFKQNKTSMVNPGYNVDYINNVIVVNNFLTKEYFGFLKKQFDNKEFVSRDFAFRKATGVNFHELHKEEYNGLLEMYYSNEVLDIFGEIIKKPVQRIALSDPNACSLLVYTNKGDHIDWHYDYSNFYGDRFVVLYILVNENADKTGMSENIFQYKYNGKVYDLKMKENSVIIFKGSEIMHKSTAINDNERRILLSMVFCDICQEKKNVFNAIYEKSKNYIIYGN